MNDPRKRAQQTTEKTKAPNHSGTSKKKQSNKSKKRYDQIIFRDWCKACGICSAFCPQKVIGRDQAGMPFIKCPDDCIGCRFCELHCPDFAITIIEREADKARVSL